MSDQETFADVHAQALIALRDSARRLAMPWWDQAEIEAREHLLTVDGTPREGVTLYELGETYDDGVVGWEDVGYQCGVAVVGRRTTDAKLDTKRRIKRTIEVLRRRWKNQRLELTAFDFETVKQHVLRVQHAPLNLSKAARGAWQGQQLIVTVWARELPDDGSGNE